MRTFLWTTRVRCSIASSPAGVLAKTRLASIRSGIHRRRKVMVLANWLVAGAPKAGCCTFPASEKGRSGGATLAERLSPAPHAPHTNGRAVRESSTRPAARGLLNVASAVHARLGKQCGRRLSDGRGARTPVLMVAVAAVEVMLGFLPCTMRMRCRVATWEVVPGSLEKGRIMRQSSFPTLLPIILVAPLWLSGGLANAGLVFNFSPTGNADADAGFAAAGARWSSALTDPVKITIAAGFRELDAGVLAQASTRTPDFSYQRLRDALIGDVTSLMMRPLPPTCRYVRSRAVSWTC